MLNCIIYAGIWGATFTLAGLEKHLPKAIFEVLLPSIFAGCILYPTVAIGWIYSRLYEERRWLISAGLGIFSAIIIAGLWIYNSNEQYYGLAMIIYGALTSVSTSIATVTAAAFSKSNHKKTKILSLTSLVAVLMGLSMFFFHEELPVEIHRQVPWFIISLGLFFTGIGAGILALITSIFVDSKKIENTA